MTKKPSKRLRLLLTARAVKDILDIERYSIEQFGKRVANRYLAKLDAALQRISAEPGLLHCRSALQNQPLPGGCGPANGKSATTVAGISDG